MTDLALMLKYTIAIFDHGYQNRENPEGERYILKKLVLLRMKSDFVTNLLLPTCYGILGDVL